MKRLTAENATTIDRRMQIVFDENGRCYKATNPQQKLTLRFVVDGNLVVGENVRCDNAFFLPEDKKIYFIELKGCDLKHACEQIFNCLKIFTEDISGQIVFGRVVLSRTSTPDIQSNQYKTLSAALRRTGGDLGQKSRVYQEVI